MTTKFPLCAAMMQLSSTLAERRQKLKLSWTPREQNYEADELSNGIVHRFAKEKEIKVEKILEKLDVFNEMVREGRKMYDDLKEIKEQEKQEGDRRRRDDRKRGEERGRRRGRGDEKKEAPLRERERW